MRANVHASFADLTSPRATSTTNTDSTQTSPNNGSIGGSSNAYGTNQQSGTPSTGNPGALVYGPITLAEYEARQQLIDADGHETPPLGHLTIELIPHTDADLKKIAFDQMVELGRRAANSPESQDLTAILPEGLTAEEQDKVIQYMEDFDLEARLHTAIAESQKQFLYDLMELLAEDVRESNYENAVEKARVLDNRYWGGVKAVGGAIGVVGAYAVLASNPAGWVVIGVTVISGVYAADQAISGATQAIVGEEIDTATNVLLQQAMSEAAADKTELVFSVTLFVADAAIAVHQIAQAMRAARAARTGVAGAKLVDELFMGPGIGKSGYKTLEEFNLALAKKYQEFVDAALAKISQDVANRIRVPQPGIPYNTWLGQQVDDMARKAMKGWLKSESITEGAKGFAKVNRRLKNPAKQIPSGQSAFRIPDVRVGNHIFDASLELKSGFTAQVRDFFSFGARRVTIIRPSTMGGGYSILR